MIKKTGFVLASLGALVTTEINRNPFNASANSTTFDVAQINDCSGATYNGAWFEVNVAEGFIAKPSLASSSNEGYDSVWFINSELNFELYIYAPQWLGTPIDLLNDSAIANISEDTEDNGQARVIKRSIQYKDERAGHFISSEAKTHRSHLTIGHRSQYQQLPKKLERMYNCFVNSVQQFAD